MNDAIALDLLRELVGEIRGLRADLRRSRAAAGDLRMDLLRAIENRYGSAPFSTAALLQHVDDSPHSEIAVALGRLVDLGGGDGRAVAVGRLLGSLDGLDRSARGNVLLYSVADRD